MGLRTIATRRTEGARLKLGIEARIRSHVLLSGGNRRLPIGKPDNRGC